MYVGKPFTRHSIWSLASLGKKSHGARERFTNLYMGCPDNSSGMLNEVFIGGLISTFHIALTILVLALNIAIVYREDFV